MVNPRSFSRQPPDRWTWHPAFLDQQLKAGKQFVFSHDPLKATGFFADEVACHKQFGLCPSRKSLRIFGAERS